MQYFLELVIGGLGIGAIYGLIAMAFAVIYKSTGLINFAIGEITMLVAYLTWSLTTVMGSSLVLVVLAAILCGVLLGLVVERLVIRPMLGEPMVSTVLVTIGLGIILQSVILLVWDASPKRLDVPVANQIVAVGGVGMRMGQITVVAILLALLAAFWAFFRYSRFGIAMRAVATDERTALLMGVSTARVQSVAWMASSAIAGIAGVFFALMYDLSPALFELGLKAFPAAILGGLDAVLGAAFSGLIVGAVENLTGGYVSSGLKEISGFVLIIVILMVRPFGLFGQRDIERV